MLAPEPFSDGERKNPAALNYRTLSYVEAKESARRHTERTAALIIAFLILAGILWVIVYIVIPYNAGWRAIRAKERQLLYQVDPQKLLAACREVQDKNLSGDPRNPKVPALIRSLKPNGVGGMDGIVDIEFGGGFFHYGVMAFKPGVRGSGTKEIIPGLWFYAEDNKVPSP